MKEENEDKGFLEEEELGDEQMSQQLQPPKFSPGGFCKRFFVCTALCAIVKSIYPSILESIVRPESVKPENGLYHLTEGSFYREIQSGDYFIKFYAPWCGHCQKLASAWAELALEYAADPLVKIGRFDCTQAQSLCRDNDVNGYPTLLYFRDGVKVETFRGSRVLSDLVEFVQKHKRQPDPHPSRVITREDFHEEIQAGITFVNFFTEDSNPSQSLGPTWDKLAGQYKAVDSAIKIVKVDCHNEQELCSQQNVKSYPTLRLYKDGDMKETFYGSRTLERLTKFVYSHQSRDEL